MTETANKIFFSGRVQGVGFRYTSLRIAKRYNLAGYVKNLPDGRVELYIQGPESDVRNCIEEISDQFLSNIRDKEVVDQPVSPQYDQFRIVM
jgi:acylphosphatase